MRPQILIVIICGLLGCMPSESGENSMAQDTIQAVLDEHRDAIMALPGVVGVGLGKCDYELCIQVLVTEDSAGLQERLASLLGEHPFVVNVTDPVKALPESD